MRWVYFEHKQLTPIQGKLNINNLRGILLQLNSNTRSVPSTLGGAAHSYVGIILSPVTYIILDQMDSFVTPAHLGALSVVDGETQYQIMFVK